MSKKRHLNLASARPEPAYVALGQKFLSRWAKEMNQGSGQPNILAVMTMVSGDDDSVWPAAPGPMFSPIAERCDLALKATREFDRQCGSNFCSMLLARAFNYSLRDIAGIEETSKDTVARDLRPAYAAFTMALAQMKART